MSPVAPARPLPARAAAAESPKSVEALPSAPAALPDAPSAVHQPAELALGLRPNYQDLLKRVPMPDGKAQSHVDLFRLPEEKHDGFWDRATDGRMNQDAFIDGLRGKFEGTLGKPLARTLEAGAGLAYVATGGDISYTLNTAKILPHSRLELGGSVKGSATFSLKLFGDR